MNKEQNKTAAQFTGYYYEFKRGEDEGFEASVLMEVVDSNDFGEIQINFRADDYQEYVTFRLKDLVRAVKEFNA